MRKYIIKQDFFIVSWGKISFMASYTIYFIASFFFILICLWSLANAFFRSPLSLECSHENGSPCVVFYSSLFIAEPCAVFYSSLFIAEPCVMFYSSLFITKPFGPTHPTCKLSYTILSATVNNLHVSFFWFFFYLPSLGIECRTAAVIWDHESLLTPSWPTTIT